VAQVVPEPDGLPTPSEIAIRPLDPLVSRAAFSSSNDVLNHYFTATGSQPRTLAYDLSLGTTTAHVMLHRETGEILGFFTLSGHTIPREQLPTAKLRKGQAENVSTTLLGRMAICSRLEGKGYGGRLLLAALAKAYIASTEYVASSAVVVDPKNEELVKFYQRYKFILLSDPEKPLRMFLPMGSVKDLLG
jgi:predicted GNAT family N-acyltransferase